MRDGGQVLVIDDDDAFRFAMKKALRRLGYEVSQAESGEAALPILKGASPPEAALLDLKMKGMDGLEVLRRMGTTNTRVVVLTGHGTVQAAVAAMGLGAFSFLEKPVDGDALAPLLADAVGEARRAHGADGDAPIPPLVGHSAAMTGVRRFIEQVGPTDETVAIYGETGTGKEVVARHIHRTSRRAGRPFVAMNAACVPRELFESELFGHRRGAFTGATADRKGLFREAHGGTLFIDEVAELPAESQAKLLRATETRTIRPVGGGQEIPVDARIVAATNRNLWGEVQTGRFREDLYFRLQVFPLVIPPLRDRRDDIAALSTHLLSRIGRGDAHLSNDALAVLERYEWPGNVRELLNVLRRATLFADGPEIPSDLARRMVAASVFGQVSRPTPPASLAERLPTQSLADLERAHIQQVLSEMEGNVTRAAAALGIDRRTLQRKLKTYGLSGT